MYAAAGNLAKKRRRVLSGAQKLLLNARSVYRAPKEMASLLFPNSRTYKGSSPPTFLLHLNSPAAGVGCRLDYYLLALCRLVLKQARRT
jgi:hypothetical protein